MNNQQTEMKQVKNILQNMNPKIIQQKNNTPASIFPVQKILSDIFPNKQELVKLLAKKGPSKKQDFTKYIMDIHERIFEKNEPLADILQKLKKEQAPAQVSTTALQNQNQNQKETKFLRLVKDLLWALERQTDTAMNNKSTINIQDMDKKLKSIENLTKLMFQTKFLQQTTKQDNKFLSQASKQSLKKYQDFLKGLNDDQFKKLVQIQKDSRAQIINKIKPKIKFANTQNDQWRNSTPFSSTQQTQQQKKQRVRKDLCQQLKKLN